MNPRPGALLVEKGKGGGGNVGGANASSLSDTEEVGKGEECQVAGAEFGGGAGFVGEKEEKVCGGPKLWRRGG